MSETDTASTVAELCARLQEPREIPIDEEGNGILVVPNGKQVIDLRTYEDARLEHPRRRRGSSTHTTLASFIEHARRHSDEHSVVFATDTDAKPSLLAIYDYNEPTTLARYEVDKPIVYTPGQPRWGQHRSSYTAPFSEEWLAWQKIAGPESPWLSQRDFAEHLEDRVLEIVPPDAVPKATSADLERLGISPAGPSTITTLTRGLIVRADRRVGSSTNLNTGEGRITFEEQHTTHVGDAPVVVPTGFVIAVPVFRDGDPHAMVVRLRYRIDGASVKWRLAMHRVDAVFRDAFSHIVTEVGSRTGRPVFFGSPE